MAEEESNFYFFIHIPKTGGTTLRNIIESQFQPHQICPDQYMMDRYHGLYPPPEWFLNVPDDEFSKFRLLRGHYHYCMHKRFSARPKIITMLRNPVDRTISHLRHIARARGIFHPDKEIQTIAKLVQENFPSYLEDLQTKFLSRDFTIVELMSREYQGKDVPFQDQPVNNEDLERAKEVLSEMDFVGVQSQFDKSIFRMSEKYSWKKVKHVPQLNASPKSDFDLSDETIELIKKHTAYDMSLYEYACNMFEENSIEFDPSTSNL